MGRFSCARRSSSSTARSMPGSAAVASRSRAAFRAVGRVGQEGADVVAHRLRRAVRRREGAPHAERFAAGGVVGHVRSHRDDHERQAMRERGQRRPRAAVADDEVAAGQQVRQRQEALDPDVRRLGTVSCRIGVRAHGRDDVQRLVPQADEDRRQERRELGIARVRAESDVDGRPGRQIGQPGRWRAERREFGQGGAYGMEGRRDRIGRVAVAGRREVEHEVARQHRQCGIGGQAERGAARVERGDDVLLVVAVTPADVDDDHRVRQPQRLGGQTSAVLGGVAHEEVRSPARGEFAQVVRHPLGEGPGHQPRAREVPHRRAGLRLLLGTQRHQRGVGQAGPGRDGVEPGRRDLRRVGRRGGEGDGMPGVAQRGGDRHQRQEMAETAAREERKERTHGYLLSR